jgi:hypothetical protein
MSIQTNTTVKHKAYKQLWIHRTALNYKCHLVKVKFRNSEGSTQNSLIQSLAHYESGDYSEEMIHRVSDVREYECNNNLLTCLLHNLTSKTY